MPALHRPVIEALESRTLLSGTVTVNSHGVLDIVLNHASNTVNVGYGDAVGSEIFVNINGVVTLVPLTGGDAQVVNQVHIHCGQGNDTVTITAGNGATTKAFDKLTVIRGGAGHDVITTGNETDLIFGGSGHDTITTGNGNDSVLGGSGHDVLTVGNGNDYVVGGGGHGRHGGDTIITGNGNDTVFGFAGEDTITLGRGNDDIYAGAADTVNAGSGADTVFIAGNQPVTINGTATVEHISRAHRRFLAAYDAAIANAQALEAGAGQY